MIQASLTKVPRTLLLPLIARAEVSRWKNPELYDEKAIQLSDSLEYDKKKIIRNMLESGMLGLAVRAKKFDAAIRNFLKTHPKATILNIGAGLDTSFYRVDNGILTWFDLDLPESMELRKKLIPPPSRVTYIEKSMLDYSWIDDIGDISNGLFIQIPGVLPYFKEETVKEFLTTISARLPDAEIIFDVCSPMGKVVISERIKKSGMGDAPLEWGITRPEKITSWGPHIQLVNAERFFKDIPKKWSYSFKTWYLMSANDRYKVSQVFHFRFV